MELLYPKKKFGKMMSWNSRGWLTHDSLSRCVLCDAPVGINSNPIIKVLGENYCEFCGKNLCPFCGNSFNDLANDCGAKDVYNNTLHFELDLLI